MQDGVEIAGYTEPIEQPGLLALQELLNRKRGVSSTMPSRLACSSECQLTPETLRIVGDFAEKIRQAIETKGMRMTPYAEQ
jgi:ribosome-binding protein aMBF1 (putative translation factor)